MSDNENNVNEMTSVEVFDDSNISNFEAHSTPSVSQNEAEISITDQSKVNEDSGIQVTPKLDRESRIDSKEVGFTDGNIAAQSTLSTTRTKVLSMDDLFNLIKTMSENINSNYKEQQIDSNVKFLSLIHIY